jgi:hypothetical protein
MSSDWENGLYSVQHGGTGWCSVCLKYVIAEGHGHPPDVVEAAERRNRDSLIPLPKELTFGTAVSPTPFLPLSADMDEPTVTLTVTRWELAKIIDGLMVITHQMRQIPGNDLTEIPAIQALLERLTAAPYATADAGASGSAPSHG